MKKFAAILLVVALFIWAFPTFASESITVSLDGEIIDCKDANGNSIPPFIVDGTTYVPLRAIASALNLEIEWDNHTKTVFINGVADAKLTDNVNIYINGSLFTAKDVNGKVVYPILRDGTTYLPVRAIGEAFDKRVIWDSATKTVVITTPVLANFFLPDTAYAIINKSNDKAISVTDKGLVTEAFGHYDYQAFYFIPTDTNGYYFIQSVANGKNFDVNGNSKAPGGKIITYTPSAADNQKFRVEVCEDGFIISALSSRLPIEDSIGTIKQNTLRDSTVQRWAIVDMDFVTEKSDTTVYRTLSSQGLYLTDGDALTASSTEDLWALVPTEEGSYIITNKATGKSLDVANNSKTSGDPVITYKTSGDDNQCWVFEKQPDGTYLIRSVHSSLYLTITNDNNIVQAELGSDAKQCWTVSIIK